ncbi:MAG: class I tRNA ligase family protein [Patescibacteria group bacterium]
MKKYNHRTIEKKWQKVWTEKNLYRTNLKSRRKKYYCLVEFPYPSGEGLHVGHIRSYTALDVIARKRRAEGFEVLYPMGWDAFGLPTENYAIKTGQPPAVITKRNVNRYRKQLQELGFSFDWSREINTADPNYYGLTQWLFLQLFKAGLAYKAKMPINWCPKDKIGLANEEVVAGCCERCGTPVEQREKDQWLLAITKYADQLDRDLDLVDYPPPVKIQQRNWIGRAEGAKVKFGNIEVFTTRPETIFGATFIARHGAADRFTGEYAINPANQEKIPVWEAEYVMEGVGTGAIMGVPTHDERDRAFAEKYNLPIREAPLADEILLKKIGARPMTTYKLHDWIFSRQRYWGEPIPLVFCEKHNWVPVSNKDLPVKLPPLKKYAPTDTGESPLASIESWVKTKCPLCGGPARRETDTMPNWAGSSWYYLAYLIKNLKTNTYNLKAKSLFKHWLPVDWYNGGLEHTTLHLLYSRFWHKALYDLKLVPTKEPYGKRTSHGLVLAANGEKMSKSRGNVVNPDELIRRFGADALRLYEMFMGPFDQAIGWKENGLVGARRFLDRVWRLAVSSKFKVQSSKLNSDLQFLVQQTIKKVTDDIEQMKFNTAISALMILLNHFEKTPAIPLAVAKTFLKLLSPFAPHLAEEFWVKLSEKKSIHLAPWPHLIKTEPRWAAMVKIVVQINGKVRDILEAPAGLTEEKIKNLALGKEKIQLWLKGKNIQRTIIVPNRLINIVLDQ